MHITARNLLVWRETGRREGGKETGREGGKEGGKKGGERQALVSIKIATSIFHHTIK